MTHARTPGVLLRSIVTQRQPIERQPETAVSFAPELFGLARVQMAELGDERIGRALDRHLRC
ncbi:MAG: hypothetical protein IT514_04975 [Burkholderiales bacterium]|nr:hypothetical protein [Burkholderiales bacterium]